MIPDLEQGWLWGLVGDHETAAIWSAEAQLAHMLRVEAALTRALGAVHGKAETAETIARAIRAFGPDHTALRDASGRDGVPVPELVRQLRAATGAERALLHTGATSQDIVDTALALTLRDSSDLIDARLAALGHALDDLSARFGAAPLPGRTRMQLAEPVTVACRIAPWRMPLDGHASDLAALRPRVEALQLGGAAGNRAMLGDVADAVAAHMARTLGLTNPPRHWQARRESVTAYADLCSRITGTLGKMGQDVALMAQQGLDEIAIAGGGGSSAMPHKRNPVLAELLVTLARFNAVQVSGMHHAMIHEQERSGTAWTLEWLILPQIVLATTRALSVATTLTGQVDRIGARYPRNT